MCSCLLRVGGLPDPGNNQQRSCAWPCASMLGHVLVVYTGRCNCGCVLIVDNPSTQLAVQFQLLCPLSVEASWFRGGTTWARPRQLRWQYLPSLLFVRCTYDVDT